MSINSQSPNELADHRKIISDRKDFGDSLSIPGKNNGNSRAIAAGKVRDLKCRFEMKYIAMTEDKDFYFNELMKEM
jgi:hypothetical protein